MKEPEKLEAMQCVYKWVTRHSEEDCGDCADKIKEFKLEKELARLSDGCFHVGRKCDVPRDACYVGHYHLTYVWVGQDGVDALTHLSLIMLDIATVDINTLGAVPTKTVERTIVNDMETSRKETFTASLTSEYKSKGVGASTATRKIRKDFDLFFTRPINIFPRPQ